MYRKDFLMRQISQLIRVLIDMILYSGKNSSARKEETFVQVYSITGIRKEDISGYDSEQLIDMLKMTDAGLDKLEMLAYTLLEESKGEQDITKQRHLRALSKNLLEYVDQHSDSFSLERKSILSGFTAAPPPASTH